MFTKVIDTDADRYPYSSLRAVARHRAWFADYLAVGDIDEALAALRDMHAIQAELARQSYSSERPPSITSS